MLDSLANPILPIFTVLLVGYFIGWRGILGPTEARNINQYAYYLGIPAIVVQVISTTPIHEFEWGAALAFLVSELVLYALMFLFLWKILKREKREAMLLGMASVFVNHVFFVLPIAERLYGSMAMEHMAGIAVFDGAILFSGTVLATELMTADNSTGGSRAARLLLKNPFTYAPIAGILLGLWGDATPAGITTFVQFGAVSVAPVILFALGVSLAAMPILQTGIACWSVVAAKLVAHPLLAYGLLQQTSSSEDAKLIALLVAAGPSGAMAFVIASQFGVKSDTIVKAILISTTLSVLSLSWLTA